MEYNENWRFEYNKTSLSSWTVCLTVIAIYVIGVPVTRIIMKNFNPHPFRDFCIIHNAFLSLASLVLFSILGSIVLSEYKQHGLYYIFCSRCIFYIY